MIDKNDSEEVKFLGEDQKSEKIKILIFGLPIEERQVILKNFQNQIDFTFAEENFKYFSGIQDCIVVNANSQDILNYSLLQAKITGKQIKLLIHRDEIDTLLDKLGSLIEQIRIRKHEIDVDSEV